MSGQSCNLLIIQFLFNCVCALFLLLNASRYCVCFKITSNEKKYNLIKQMMRMLSCFLGRRIQMMKLRILFILSMQNYAKQIIFQFEKIQTCTL
jgi:hypothetical protein